MGGASKHKISSDDASPSVSKRQRVDLQHSGLASATDPATKTSRYPFGKQPVNQMLLEKETAGFNEGMALHHFVNINAAKLYNAVHVRKRMIMLMALELSGTTNC